MSTCGCIPFLTMFLLVGAPGILIGHPKNSSLIAMWLFHVLGTTRTHLAQIGQDSLLVTLLSSSAFPLKIYKEFRGAVYV